jgi:hypothetical protein
MHEGTETATCETETTSATVSGIETVIESLGKEIGDMTITMIASLATETLATELLETSGIRETPCTVKGNETTEILGIETHETHGMYAIHAI